MKKILAAACALFIAFGIAGCKEEKEHEHEWNAGEVTREATYTHTGEKTFSCLTCGRTRTEKIAALAFSADVTVNAGESISAAVKAAEDGDFILVKAGTYREQLVIEDKNVSVIGEGTVVVAGPENYASMKNVEKPAGEQQNYTALGLIVGADALIENVSFTGDPDKANVSFLTGENAYCGVAAILFAAAEEEEKTLTVRYSEITGFNKTGAVVRGGVSELLFVGNTVQGAGEQPRNCQNGLQVECDRAEIAENTFKNLVYSKEDEWKHASWGLLIYAKGDKGVVVSANTFDNVDNGVYIVSNGSTDLPKEEATA